MRDWSFYGLGMESTTRKPRGSRAIGQRAPKSTRNEEHADGERISIARRKRAKLLRKEISRSFSLLLFTHGPSPCPWPRPARRRGGAWTLRLDFVEGRERGKSEEGFDWNRFRRRRRRRRRRRQRRNLEREKKKRERAQRGRRPYLGGRCAGRPSRMWLMWCFWCCFDLLRVEEGGASKNVKRLGSGSLSKKEKKSERGAPGRERRNQIFFLFTLVILIALFFPVSARAIPRYLRALSRAPVARRATREFF